MAYVDHSTSVPDYFSRFNPDILKLIPPDAQIVLEIGCGAGALAAAYRRVNPRVEWYGVEPNHSAASHAFAADHVDYVCRKPLEECDFDNESFPDQPFDVLILGDVLEHMANPWEQLKRLAAMAQAGAQILACIPNVGHWTIVRDLLKGEWGYADEGLLDRTHLRFFTLASIKSMFADAGLHVFEVRGRMLCNQGFEEWVQESGVNLDAGMRNQLQAYQYVVRALKPRRWQGESDNDFVVPQIQKTHIHAVVHRCPENGTCCERPRIDEPLAALATIPGVKTSRHIRGENGRFEPCPDGSVPNILIQQRFQWIDLKTQLEFAARGCLLIADWDDLPEIFPAQVESDFIALRAVHAVQVSTEKLAEAVRPYNPNVAVFENQLAELPPWENKIPPQDGSIRIFFGALNRGDDWKPIMPALQRIAREFAGVLDFIVVHDKAFYHEICGYGCASRFHEFLPYGEYIQRLRSCDIALLPLEPTPFNSCKSDIKFLECAANGVAVLASETVYSGAITVEHKFHNTDEHGFLYDSPERFERLFRRLIESPQDRTVVARLAWRYVRDNRMLGQHYRKRHEWYLSLLANRERLHKELLERVPELKGAE